MRPTFWILLALSALAPARARANPLPAPAAGMKRWIVTFHPSVKRAGREADLAALGVKTAAHIASDGNTDNEFSAAVVDLPEGRTLTNPEMGMGDIESIEADRRVLKIDQAAISFAATPFGAGVGGFNFPKAGQYPFPRAGELPLAPAKMAAMAVHPEIKWNIDRVHAPAAWDMTEGCDKDGECVKVAIIDTGIDCSHPDLVGKVDGGYSAITGTELKDDYQDDNGHGTHVSGIVAALRDGKGVVGVAPRARLYAVKVLDATGSGDLADVIDGIVWAAKNGMQVANMSLGSPSDSAALHKAVRYAKGNGLIIVAAAGNSGASVGFPAAYPEVIAVAASNDKDELAPFSSRGPQLKAHGFIAPGMDIVSDKLGGGLIAHDGTSMAAPHVAGLAALAMAQGAVGLTGPDGVLVALQRAAKPLPGLTEDEQGAGMIDAGKLTH